MDFQFVIPRNSLELLDSDGNKYYVKQVYDARELPEMLKGSLSFFFMNTNDIFVIITSRSKCLWGQRFLHIRSFRYILFAHRKCQSTINRAAGPRHRSDFFDGGQAGQGAD